MIARQFRISLVCAAAGLQAPGVYLVDDRVQIGKGRIQSRFWGNEPRDAPLPLASVRECNYIVFSRIDTQ